MLIIIGRVLKPWGVKGDLKIEPITDFPDRFVHLKRVYLTSPDNQEIVCEVESVKQVGTVPHIRLKGYDTPEKAARLAGWVIQIPREEAVSLPEGSYYRFEIIGMDVFTESGEKLGAITDIFETGSNDVYVLNQGGKEIYLPATAEIVKEIDTTTNRMIIHVIDGLLD